LKQIRIRASDFVKENLDIGVRRVLQELRTLARLEHRKIVRYYHSWTEYNQGRAVAQPESTQNAVEPRSTITEEPSFSDENKLSVASGINIVFENSESADRQISDSVSEDTESLDNDDVHVVFEGLSDEGASPQEIENATSCDTGVSEDSESETVTENASSVFADGSSAPGRALIKRRASSNEPRVP
jgi:hypothetical protein